MQVTDIVIIQQTAILKILAPNLDPRIAILSMFQYEFVVTREVSSNLQHGRAEYVAKMIP